MKKRIYCQRCEEAQEPVNFLPGIDEVCSWCAYTMPLAELWALYPDLMEGYSEIPPHF